MIVIYSQAWLENDPDGKVKPEQFHDALRAAGLNCVIDPLTLTDWGYDVDAVTARWNGAKAENEYRLAQETCLSLYDPDGNGELSQ